MDTSTNVSYSAEYPKIRQRMSWRNSMPSLGVIAVALQAVLLVMAFGAKNAGAQATITDIDGEELQPDQFQQEASVAEVDSNALVAYYYSMNGDQWRDNSGWLQDQVVNWVGVSAVEEVNDGEWRVTEIDMPRNNMREPGTFPVEMADLDYVWQWVSDVDLITGQLIPEITEMERLEEIMVRTNILHGPLPWDEFGQMDTMEEFRVRQNYFTGEMPEMLGDNGEWPVVRRFYLDGNLIQGQIPEVHEDLQSLNRIYFHNLRLTGPIPDWSHINELEYYRIAGNNLDQGPIPDWIGESWSETLVRFQIHNTNRTGSIPDWFTTLENLEQFIIGGEHDQIGEGETLADIPDMSNMPSLRRINLTGGQWSGDFSDLAWMGTAGDLEDITLVDMDISGEIPADLAGSDAINLIHLENLNIEGSLPDQFQVEADGLNELIIRDNDNFEQGPLPGWLGNELGDIEELELSKAGVTGEIADGNLGNLNLSVLSLRDNPELTGELPTWMPARDWSTLELGRTGLDIDEIPGWIADEEGLSTLGLGGLGLSGELPDFFGQGDLAISLSSLALDDNNLTGSIPSAYGNIQELDSLNLAHNDLSGEIPNELANAGHIAEGLHLLEALVLSGNQDLTGEIPMEFTNAEFMRVLEYEDTGLCGPDDASYQNWIDGIPDFAAEVYPEAYWNVSVPEDCPEAVSADDQFAGTPNSFRLHENYPNPFNPTTNITFEIHENTQVSLTIYNVIGERIATVVDEQRVAGTHEVTFDATGLASGTYIYRLEAGDRMQSETMMLIK